MARLGMSRIRENRFKRGGHNRNGSADRCTGSIGIAGLNADGIGSGRGAAIPKICAFPFDESTATGEMLRVIHAVEPYARRAENIDGLRVAVRSYLNEIERVGIAGSAAVLRRGDGRHCWIGAFPDGVADGIG